MAVVAGEAAGGADPGDAVGHAGEAGEDGLALEVAGGVGALVAVVAAQHQIRLQLLGLDAVHVLPDGDCLLDLVLEDGVGPFGGHDRPRVRVWGGPRRSGSVGLACSRDWVWGEEDESWEEQI